MIQKVSLLVGPEFFGLIEEIKMTFPLKKILTVGGVMKSGRIIMWRDSHDDIDPMLERRRR